jgi:hypothetical protein
VLGIGDPINATEFTAAGAVVADPLLTISVPAAYLPNGTMVYNELTTITQGDEYTFAITHVHGDWWTYTYNGNAITGSDAWENGTYNLGFSVASGAMCEEGATVGPSFVALLYGDDGAATPSLPTTSVPWAIGIGSKGSAPQAANAMPQFNSSLGKVGIQSHIQNSALGINHLKVGNSVAYPGAYVPLWGNYKIVILNTSTMSPISASLAYNGTQIFNATAINQNGVPIPAAKYSWQLSPSTLGMLSASTGPSVTLTAGSASSAGKLWANVSYNCSVISDVASITVTKTGGPSINSFAATPPMIVLGGSSVFTVTNGTWSQPILYQYTGLPHGCTSANLSTLSCTPTLAGNYTVTVFLNDSLKHSSSATTNLLVYPDLASPTFTVTPSTLTVNTSTNITVTVVGGIPPLTYYYTGLPSGCPDNTIQPSTFSCIPNASGAFTPRVFINDSAGHSVNTTSSMTVNVKLSISSFTASPSTIPYGGTTFLNVTAVGGTPPYTYAYHQLPAGCTSANSKSIACTPAHNGSYIVYVNVTDASGFNASSVALFYESPPAYLTISSFAVTPSTVSLGTSINVSAVVIGGTTPYTYAYSGMPAGCTGSTKSSFICTPTASGSFTLNLTVTDAKEAVVYATASLTVTGPSITSFTVAPSSITQGSSATFTTVVSGSNGPYTFTYTGLPAGCTSQNTSTLSCTPTATGTFTVTVFVNDSAGFGVSSTTSLTVNSSTTTSGMSSTLLLIIIVVVVVVVVAVVALLLLRKKKKPAQAPPPPSYYAPPPQQQYMGPPPQQGPPPQ